MSVSRFGRYALGVCVAAAILAGCGGSQGAPIAAGAVPQGQGIRGDSHRGLIYVAKVCGGACIFSYPGGKLVGTISTPNVDGAPCADANGNVFIPTEVASQYLIYEYAHGSTTPTATLKMPYASNGQGCSVDPTTGNLAASYLASPRGGVAIFQNAQGAPTLYQDPNFGIEFCGYDNQGNLFVDGFGGGSFQFAEMPKDANTFTDISVNFSVRNEGQIQWDGQYITVEDMSGVIYRLQVSGSQASVVGTVEFTNIKRLEGGSWINGSSVIAMYQKGHKIQRALGFWKYPAGGKHTASMVITGFGQRGSQVLGVALSKG